MLNSTIRPPIEFFSVLIAKNYSLKKQQTIDNSSIKVAPENVIFALH